MQHITHIKEINAMKKVLVTIVMLVLTIAITQAQEAAPRVTYFIAEDGTGIDQVYQLVLGVHSEPRQITQAASDVITFGAAYDGLGIAYISDGELVIQAVDSDASEVLAPIAATQFFSGPVFSPDGQYLAYADNGVWIMDLGTRETELVLENVPLEEMASNAAEFRIYVPEMFVMDENGMAEKLIVDVGIWEWNTVGVYDLQSGDFQELEGQFHTDLLPLADGRVLLYGNSGVAGEPTIDIAASLDDINTHTELVNFGALIENGVLFANQAVEIEPGVVRVFGPHIRFGQDSAGEIAMYFDYDLDSGEMVNTNTVSVASDEEFPNVQTWTLSPDGSIVPVYNSPLWTDAGSIYGEFMLIDLNTGEVVSAPFPEIVSIFRWLPS
jgi:hypothetical protein